MNIGGIRRFFSGFKGKMLYPYDNIYYCCTQKTASQWLKAVFSDPVFYKATGLDVVLNQKKISSYREIGDIQRLPSHCMAAHYYVDYNTYASIPKPEKHKAFFIMRDPRDIVISWYFSTLHSHTEKHVATARHNLKTLDQKEGIKYAIDYLENYGLFWAQLTWAEATQNEKVRIFYYEDIAKDNRVFITDLLEFLDVSIRDSEMLEMCERHQFTSYSKGREKGNEDIKSHYRKGVAGDWKNYFDSDIKDHFDSVTDSIHKRLGYG